jgi:hypothetical protein
MLLLTTKIFVIKSQYVTTHYQNICDQVPTCLFYLRYMSNICDQDPNLDRNQGWCLLVNDVQHLENSKPEGQFFNLHAQLCET